jgi:hypothetical protein
VFSGLSVGLGICAAAGQLCNAQYSEHRLKATWRSSQLTNGAQLPRPAAIGQPGMGIFLRLLKSLTKDRNPILLSRTASW